MSWNNILTENKKHEESLAGSVKRTQVVFTALFSCQERCLWKWHAFHGKLWGPRAILAPRRHTDMLGDAHHQPRNSHLSNLFLQKMLLDFLLSSGSCFKFGEQKHNKNSYHILCCYDDVDTVMHSLFLRVTIANLLMKNCVSENLNKLPTVPKVVIDSLHLNASL